MCQSLSQERRLLQRRRGAFSKCFVVVSQTPLISTPYYIILVCKLNLQDARKRETCNYKPRSSRLNSSSITSSSSCPFQASIVFISLISPDVDTTGSCPLRTLSINSLTCSFSNPLFSDAYFSFVGFSAMNAGYPYPLR